MPVRRPRATWPVSFFALAAGILSLSLPLPAPSQAQSIKLDGSLGSRITLTGPAYTIPHDLGQTRGANLFHSFEQFNILTGESATFTGPNTVQRVISRVTGGVQSFIDGLLGTDFVGAKPEFYLINPSGLLFGPNASLNVSGSAHFSTADYLRFADQTGRTGLFAKLSETTTLSVEPVAAFGFMGSTPVAITMQGSALQVLGSQSFSVIGGDLSLVDATLAAPSGNVNLISVGSTGIVSLLANNAWDVSSFSNLGQVSAKMTTGSTTKPSVDVSGDSSGTIMVRGGQLTVDHTLFTAKTTGMKDGAPKAIDILTSSTITIINGAELSAGTKGTGSSGTIQINTRAGVLITGSGTFQEGTSQRNRQSQITSISELGSTGRGSDIGINAGRLEVTEGGQLTLRTQDTGRGGDALLQAGAVLVQSSQPLATSNILAITERTGTAGDLHIASKEIEVGLGGAISNVTQRTLQGHSGSVLIDASGGMVKILGTVSAVSRTPAGDVVVREGNVDIRAGNMTLEGLIESGSISGEGGNIRIKADTLTIDGKGGGAGTPAATGGNIKLKDTFTGSANIGAIDIDVTNLTMVNKAEIGADRLVGPGKAGGVTIKADKMLMDGSTIHATVYSADGSEVRLETHDLTLRNESLISTQTLGNGIGNAGNITVNTDNLTLLNGSPITSSTNFGTGRAGSVAVHAKGTITVSGVRASDPQVESGLFSVTSGPGDAGSVSVEARNMFVHDGGLITALSDGTGNGGVVDLKVTSLLELSSGGIISSETRGAGKGGSISIEADLVRVTGRRSGIFSNTYASIADFGLNLNIQHTFDSDLTAALISPRGTQVSLFSGVGGSGENFVGTHFDDRVGSPIQQFAFAPFTGTFTPMESFGKLIGESTNGTWRLAILDSFKGDQGTLTQWSLDIGNNRAISTNVPVTIKDNAVAVSSLPVSLEPQTVVNAVKGETARGGDITLNARTTEISDEGIISASTYGTGRGGTITANVSEDLLLQKDGAISASTLRSGVGAGNAGTVTLTAAGTMSLTASSITTDAAEGLGGDTTLRAQSLVLREGSAVSTRSTGRGNSGNILIVASDLFHSQDSQVTTEAAQAFGGNIEIQTQRMIQLTDSRIVTSVQTGAGNGGNITIDPQFLILDNTQILAQAVAGNGGNISIVAGTMMVSPGSEISASSQLGVSGQVAIQAPVNNIAAALSRLSQSTLNAAELLTARCSARLREGTTSSLTMAGRDGVPAEPGSYRPTAFVATAYRPAGAPTLTTRAGTTIRPPLVLQSPRPEFYALRDASPLPLGCGS